MLSMRKSGENEKRSNGDFDANKWKVGKHGADSEIEGMRRRGTAREKEGFMPTKKSLKSHWTQGHHPRPL